MGKLHIHRLYYLLAAILLAGFIVGVFYLKVLLRGATVILYTLLLGMALGFIISIILIRLKKAFLLLKHKVQYFQGLNGQGVGVVKE